MLQMLTKAYHYCQWQSGLVVETLLAVLETGVQMPFKILKKIKNWSTKNKKRTQKPKKKNPEVNQTRKE